MSSTSDSKTRPKDMRVSNGNVELLKFVPQGNFQCPKEMRIESDYKLQSLSEVEYLFKTCLSSLEVRVTRNMEMPKTQVSIWRVRASNCLAEVTHTQDRRTSAQRCTRRHIR
ncbi:hypothetical protein RND81_10G014600 [Saponaria officinalis]|uniref:Uncharacterized protein n=1 Tax=Saponaria officinalis TaxID=3572 RepID=A0AAW1HXR5_SAPOF